MRYPRFTFPAEPTTPGEKMIFRVPARRTRAVHSDTHQENSIAEAVDQVLSDLAFPRGVGADPALTELTAPAAPVSADAGIAGLHSTPELVMVGGTTSADTGTTSAGDTGMTSAFGTVAPEDDALTGMVDVVGITELTHDVMSFELRAAWLEAVDFAPGQYVTLRVPGLEAERCYSISSAPFGTNTFTITVKRVRGGTVSTHLHDRVAIGDQVHIDGPYGLYSTSFHPANKHLFISGGSGITPNMSMVRALLADPGHGPVDIVIVHNAATPADIIFRAELDQLAEIPGVQVLTMCSRDSAAEVWAGKRGRVDAEALADAVPGLHEREVFVCGPAEYMAAVRLILDGLGVSGARVHEESFVFGTTPAERMARADFRSIGQVSGENEAAEVGSRNPGACNPLAKFGIEFRNAGVSVECDGSTTVLEAALAAGLSVPSSCAEGACGTCKSLLVTGEVEMNHAGGIRPKEVAAGKFLPCCSTPKSDLVVE